MNSSLIDALREIDASGGFEPSDPAACDAAYDSVQADEGFLFLKPGDQFGITPKGRRAMERSS